jgi:hypothetical protein
MVSGGFGMKMNFPVSFKNHSMAHLSSVQLKYRNDVCLSSFTRFFHLASPNATRKHLEQFYLPFFPAKRKQNNNNTNKKQPKTLTINYPAKRKPFLSSGTTDAVFDLGI